MTIEREDEVTIKYAARIVNETGAFVGDFGHIQFVLRDLIRELEKDYEDHEG